MPDRIRLSRAKGWRLSEGAVNVARPGPLGNPFVVGKYGTRAQCVSAFAMLAAGYINLGTPHVEVEEQIALYRRIHRRLRDIAGHDIACWCAIDGQSCHGDVLLYLANGGNKAGLACFHVDPPRPGLFMLIGDLERAMPTKAVAA